LAKNVWRKIPSQAIITTMKLVFAMLCCVLLAGTPFVPAPAPSCFKHPAHACHCGGIMPCCAASHAPKSPAAPAVPAPSSAQNHLLLLAPAIVASLLSHCEVQPISFAAASPWTRHGVPLFAWNCARLI
jgi:hypothetical protein